MSTAANRDTGEEEMNKAFKSFKDFSTFVLATPNPSSAIETLGNVLRRFDEFHDERAAASELVFSIVTEEESKKLAPQIKELCKGFGKFGKLPGDKREMIINQIVGALKIECIINTAKTSG